MLGWHSLGIPELSIQSCTLKPQLQMPMKNLANQRSNGSPDITPRILCPSQAHFCILHSVFCLTSHPDSLSLL